VNGVEIFLQPDFPHISGRTAYDRVRAVFPLLGEWLKRLFAAVSGSVPGEEALFCFGRKNLVFRDSEGKSSQKSLDKSAVQVLP